MLLTSEIRESVVFENNKQKIFGILHRPESDQKIPALVIFHGFASHKIGKNRAYVKLAENLCKQGIAVLRFDFRGAGDSEGSFSEMTISSLISDGYCAMNYLVNHSNIDSQKIGILGSSLGGAIAVLSGALVNLKALVLWAPVASGGIWLQDWLANQKSDKDEKQKPLTMHNGHLLHPDFRSEFIAMDVSRECSQLNNVPLLHIHGEKDDVISLTHRDFYKNIRAQSPTESKFLLIPDTDHALGYSIHFQRILEETTLWLTTHLFN